MPTFFQRIGVSRQRTDSKHTPEATRVLHETLSAPKMALINEFDGCIGRDCRRETYR